MERVLGVIRTRQPKSPPRLRVMSYVRSKAGTWIFCAFLLSGISYVYLSHFFVL